ncbi:MAG: hypothetical protein AAB617_01620 [Patescibacteria group bacterium]
MKIFVYTIIVIVLAAIITGFFIVGSPKEERLRKLDEMRVNNLQFLQSEIVNYWTNKGKLPVGLTDLEDSIRGISIPKDPTSVNDYTYGIKGDLAFSLCATFDRPSFVQESNPYPTKPVPVAREPYYMMPDNWEHGVGFTCFERTIDKDLYPPRAGKF